MVEQGSWQSPRQQPWGAPGTSAAAPLAPAAATVTRGRPGLAAFVAGLAEIVIIAAAFNQGVTTHILNFADSHGESFSGLSVRSFLVYAWRVSPAHGDNHGGFHQWYRELVTLGVLFVLTALLVALFVRGAVTFWKAFFGTWFTVALGTCVAAALGSLVEDVKYVAPSPFSKGSAAVFSVVSGGTLFAGVVLGLVVALITAIVATVSRRAAVAAASTPTAAGAGYVAPESPPPYYGDDREAARNEPQWSSRPDPRADAATTTLPTLPPEDEGTRSTTRLPRPDAPAPGWQPGQGRRVEQGSRVEPGGSGVPGARAEEASTGDQPTAAYPVPPDEDSGRR
jgi:hypothetical protein